MLQEILSQMYIDPELLEQLSEENKQVLFRKMREEQIRRWTEREKELDKKPVVKNSPRKIMFNMGADGKPWVWVMGEHKDDLPYDELVRQHEQEEMEKEKQRELQDRKEAEQLAKEERMGIQKLATKIGALVKFRKPSKKSVTNSPSAQIPENSHLSAVRTESQMSIAQSPMMGRRGEEYSEEEEERERTLSRKASIIGVTDEEQAKFEKQRTEEVFTSLQRARSISKKRAAAMAENVENWWQESHKKANEFERVRKTSFKIAQELTAKSPDIPNKILENIPQEKQKEIIRRMTLEKKPHKPRRPAPEPPRGRSLRKQVSSFVRPGTVPKSAAHATSWFNKTEAPKGIGREKDGSCSIWFHGKLSRDAAVRLLDSKPVGSFLLRLSTKIWGYTVSVKTYTACKHFLIDATSGQYCFVGIKQQKFPTLAELMNFYRVNPITWSGQEVLLIPVGLEEENNELYKGLYDDEGLNEEILAELDSDYQGSTL